MIWTYKDLYEGFLAESGKFNIDGEIARASFQDFEIEHFLNSAYRKILTQKINSYDQFWLPREARKGAMQMTGELSQKQEDPGIISNDTAMISEFGTLVIPKFIPNTSIHAAISSEENGAIAYVYGNEDHTDYITSVNGTTNNYTYFIIGNTADVLPPRILTANLTIFNHPLVKDEVWPTGGWNNALQGTYYHTPLRPITALDRVKNKAYFSDYNVFSKLPYRYYNVARKNYFPPLTGTNSTAKPTPTTMATAWMLEVNRAGLPGLTNQGEYGSWIWVFLDAVYIKTPERISIKQADFDNTLEVAFGEEIILTAVAMADNTLKKKITPD